jgi:hypothetical protein
MLRKIKKYLKNNVFFWRYYLNFKSSLRYLIFTNNDQSEVVEDIVKKLRTNGIAISDAKVVLGEILYNELERQAFLCKNNSTPTLSDKEYAKFYLPRVYDASSIWAIVAESKSIKAISEDYFKMKSPRLAYYDLWENWATDASPKNAQLWHRDRDDLQILKIFIYSTDVDEKNGAFFYAPGTHKMGNVKKEPYFFLEDNKTPRSYEALGHN